MIPWQKLRSMDWWLSGAILFLLATSTTMMYSINGDRYHKQLLFCIVGLAVFIIVTLINYHWWQNYAYFFYLVGIILLTTVLIFGKTINGTKGWFEIGSLSFQPVELAKIVLVITLARYCKDHLFTFNTWASIAKATALILPYIGLILLQPDWGSAGVIVVTFFIMLWLTNIPIRRFGIIAGSLLLTVVITVIIGWQYLEDYQKNRLLVFINPDVAPRTAGYNVKQSIISVGSGQWFGRGLGLGTQSQLRFLPERETDFIFAVVAEELGFFGAALVLLMLGTILWRIWRIIQFNNEEYGSYFSAGIIIIIFVHTMVNVGMNIGIMPVTGIPLPFISAGGSSLLSLLFALGMIQNYSIQNH